VRVPDPRGARGWVTPAFDDADWVTATVWTEAEVSPKDGYDQIAWDESAELVWVTDLEVDNTVLLRNIVLTPPS
jgi:hypothetical protein